MRWFTKTFFPLSLLLLFLNGCFITWSNQDSCDSEYFVDESGQCQYCDCWGCWPADQGFCNPGDQDACQDALCVEGCYFDGASQSCVETWVCQSDAECFSNERCDVDRRTCVPADRPSCVSAETECGDGNDNDGDGVVDCDDSDCCFGDACVSQGVCQGVEDCWDWQDNDFDGSIDCGDSDCAQDPRCTDGFCGDAVLNPGEACDDGNQVGGDGCSAQCSVENPTAEDCTNNADDDNDGSADCADTDCAGDANCQVECVLDTDCGPTQVCTNGVCCDDGSCIPNGRNPTCQFDYECGAGACLNGFCHDDCAVNTDCPTGQTCQNELCQADPVGGQECVFNTDCVASGEGEFCVNGYCHQACTAEVDCASNENCRGGICQPDDDRKSQCNVNADCGIAGQQCVNAVCRFSCDNNTDCETSCGTGSECSLGFCLFPNEVAPECSVDADCTAGNVCLNATCTSIP